MSQNSFPRKMCSNSTYLAIKPMTNSICHISPSTYAMLPTENRLEDELKVYEKTSTHQEVNCQPKMAKLNMTMPESRPTCTITLLKIA